MQIFESKSRFTMFPFGSESGTICGW